MSYNAKIYQPQGADQLIVADGFAQCVPIATAGERLKLTVDAGGASKTGTFDIVIEGVCLS